MLQCIMQPDSSRSNLYLKHSILFIFVLRNLMSLFKSNMRLYCWHFSSISFSLNFIIRHINFLPFSFLLSLLLFFTFLLLSCKWNVWVLRCKVKIMSKFMVITCCRKIYMSRSERKWIYRSRKLITWDINMYKSVLKWKK